MLAPHGRFLLVDFGAPPTRAARVLLTIGSLFDGRDNMRANLAGELPAMLTAAGSDVIEIGRPDRGGAGILLPVPKAPSRAVSGGTPPGCRGWPSLLADPVREQRLGELGGQQVLT